MEAKRALVIAKLEQRHRKPMSPEVIANGKESKNQKQDGYQILGDGDFSTDFQRRFYAERSSIDQKIDLIQNEMGNSLRVSSENQKIEEIITRVSKLQILLNESTSILPSYEIRKANSSLQELQEKLKRIRSEVQPQKRFVFTNIKPVIKSTLSASTVPSINGISNGKDASDGLIKAIVNSKSSAAAVVVQNRRNENNIILSSADCQGKDVLLLDCQSCTIRLLGVSTTVHAKDLIDCTILSYPVSTSIFIERCQRTVFVAACQQLRMHSSTNCDLYLHVTTAAIIEDCQKLHFAPYADAIENENTDELLEKSDLDKTKNNWNQVQDFNWLVADQPSPNWHVLPIDQWRRFRLTIV